MIPGFPYPTHSEASSRGSSDAAGYGAFAYAFVPVAVAWLTLFAWSRPLATPDEGRYTHIARWMTRSGDWLIPRIDGLPFLHKPPLYYWLEAAVINVFGLSLLSARIVSLAAGLVICLCIYAIVRRYDGPNAARWSIAVLLTSPLFFAGAQFANLDMLVSACITATLTLAVLAVNAEGRKARLLWIAAYATAGLGVLAKGLIGVVFPGGAFVIWALVKGRPEHIRDAISPIGLVVFLAIVVPWFAAVESRIPGFVHYFFIYHHFERFLTDEFNGQYGVWFYPLIVGAGLLPWSAALPGLIKTQWPNRRHSRRLLGLGLVWFALVIAFFSLPASKMIGYIFPLLPAAALIAGPFVSRWRWRWPALAVAALLCVGLGVMGPHWQKHSPMALAELLAAQIGPDDDVVYMDWLYYDVAVRLDRSRPAYLNGDWSHRSTDMPDSLQRQLVEGREFEPTTGYVLVDENQLQRLIVRNDRTTWVFVDKQSHYPTLGRLEIVAEDGRTRLLRAGPPHS